nr:MAG TPA: protein of unknown function DUF2460 [Caudoviricetes sp.]
MALTAKKVYAILKRQISDMEAKLNSPVRYRGTVATADLLPLNPDIGDMYNIESKSVYGEAGMNVAWNGVVWDTMGAPIDMSLYFTKEEAEEVIQRLVTEYFEKNPVKPGATTEQAQQIKQNTDDVASLKEDIDNEKGKINYIDETIIGYRNLIGKELGKLYPIFAQKGNKFYIKKMDNGRFGYLKIQFYDNEKNKIENGYYGIVLQQGRKFTYDVDKIGYYVAFEKSDEGQSYYAIGSPMLVRGDVEPQKYILYNEKNILERIGDIESIQELDRIYDGVDLSIKFAEEIKKYSDIWQWIKAGIKAGNFAGIHVNDFIRWQTTDNNWIESHVAGINTYKRYSDREVPNHIDFISKGLWPTPHVMNPVNYNNGIIPTENLSGDGTKTAFVLTNEMAAVASVTIGGTATTAYTYDADTHTITFTAAPAAGTNNIVVTGTGSEYPWLASDLYLYVNSLKGHVAGGTSKTSPVKLVDYTKDGIWSKLPEALKAVIVTKRALIPKRYSTSGVLSNNNDCGWQDMGKLWIPSEVEVYGCGVWANNALDKGGFVQYPIFNCNMRRVKGLGDGVGRASWWLISANAGDTGSFCRVAHSGDAANAIASTTWAGLPVCFRITA